MRTSRSSVVCRSQACRSRSPTSGSAFASSTCIGQGSGGSAGSRCPVQRRRSSRSAGRQRSRHAGRAGRSAGSPPVARSNSIRAGSSRSSTGGSGEGRCGAEYADSSSARGSGCPAARRRHASRYAMSAPMLCPKKTCGCVSGSASSDSSAVTRDSTPVNPASPARLSRPGTATGHTDTCGLRARCQCRYVEGPPPAWGKQNSRRVPGTALRGRDERGEFVGESCHRGPDLVLGVARGDEEAQPREVFRHGRVEDGVHVDAAPEQGVGQGEGAE